MDDRAREQFHQALTDTADHVDDAKTALRRTHAHRVELEQRESLNSAGRHLDAAEHDLFEARDPTDPQLHLDGAA